MKHSLVDLKHKEAKNMKAKSKFMLIYEEIMEKLVEIENSPISFKFSLNEKGEIISTFSDVDEEGNVIVITSVNAGKKTNFNVQEQEEDPKFMDEKQFMMNFQKTYESYKKALDKYKKENKLEHNNTDVVIVDKSSTPVPEIKSFSEILKQADANPKSDGTEIKTKSTIFTFKKELDDQYKNIAYANFILLNPDPEDDELTKYDATALIKISDKNSVIMKIKLNNSTTGEEVESITSSDLKEKYPNVFNDLRSAISMFEKEANQNKIDAE